jgi:hypothetical protein
MLRRNPTFPRAETRPFLKKVSCHIPSCRTVTPDAELPAIFLAQSSAFSICRSLAYPDIEICLFLMRKSYFFSCERSAFLKQGILPFLMQNMEAFCHAGGHSFLMHVTCFYHASCKNPAFSHSVITLLQGLTRFSATQTGCR